MGSRGRVDTTSRTRDTTTRGITRVDRIRVIINLLHRNSSRINSNTVKVSLLLLQDNPDINPVLHLVPVHLATKVGTTKVPNKDTTRARTIKDTTKEATRDTIKVTGAPPAVTVPIPSVKSADFSPRLCRPLFRGNILDRMEAVVMAAENLVNTAVELRE